MVEVGRVLVGVLSLSFRSCLRVVLLRLRPHPFEKGKRDTKEPHHPASSSDGPS